MSKQVIGIFRKEDYVLFVFAGSVLCCRFTEPDTGHHTDNSESV